MGCVTCGEDTDAKSESLTYDGRARTMATASSNLGQQIRPRPGRGARRSGYVLAIVINAVMIYLIDQVPGWELAFVTPAFVDVIGWLDLSLVASIVANTLYLGYDARWFRNLLGAATSAAALASSWMLYAVFPFELGGGIDELARLGLLLVCFACGVAIVVQILTVPFALFRSGEQE